MMLKTEGLEGNGVLSAQDEQIALIKESLSDIFEIVENSKDGGDITHYYSINFDLFLTISAMKKRGKTIGVVHLLPETTANGINLPKFVKKIFYKYITTFYKKMDYLITMNPNYIDILKKYGIKREKVFYIPNCVSNQNFYPINDRINQENINQENTNQENTKTWCENAKRTKGDIRKEYHLEEERFTVLCVEQIQNREGIIDLFEIALQMPEVQFVWVGDFLLGKLLNDYDEISEFLRQPPENVKFLGRIEQGEMNDIYNMADVMFLPFFGEEFPTSIIESMCCNIPILVRGLETYKPILSNYTLAGNSNEEFIHILTKLMIDTKYYRDAVEKAVAGNRFYSKEHVSQMWRTYYNHILFTQSEEFREER